MLAEQPARVELPKGLDAAWDTATGRLGRLVPRRARFVRHAAEVLALEKEYSGLTDATLREQAQQLRESFFRGRETHEHRIRGFALVREVAARQLGERPFLVQVAGGLAIEAGCVAEMATGEGKTLTATMPATIGGWRGRGCHVITVNDYLARRDAEWMRKIYGFCGLTVAHVEQEMHPTARRESYRADVTYCTNKEVTADYLRDRLSLGRLRDLSAALLSKIVDGSGAGTDRLVQRGLHTAIVDEADSVLVDEAVTPLIISGEAPNEEQVEAFRQAADLASQLDAGRHFRINDRYREVDLTSAGKQRLTSLAESLHGLWQGARRREELVTQALTARHFYQLGKQYIVDDGKVVIVDEFTGRLMPDRNWRDGLHQAVEAKESLEVNPPKDTYNRISFQRFFRLYRKLSGMTGTAREATPEFWQVYHRQVVLIPTNRPCVRQQWPIRVFGSEAAKWDAVVAEIERIHNLGRPILVGTRSVRASEHLSAMLVARGMEHEVLNAVNEAREAQIVAQAGQLGRITIATNMAGRGTNILLGQGVVDVGGLHVLATECHEAGRIDRQLFGRAGRQGEPGSAQAFVSLEDELTTRYTPHIAASLRKRSGPAEITSPLARRLVKIAQRKAERMALRQRKGVLRTDEWLDEHLGFAGSEV